MGMEEEEKEETADKGRGGGVRESLGQSPSRDRTRCCCRPGPAKERASRGGKGERAASAPRRGLRGATPAHHLFLWLRESPGQRQPARCLCRAARCRHDSQEAWVDAELRSELKAAEMRAPSSLPGQGEGELEEEEAVAEEEGEDGEYICMLNADVVPFSNPTGLAASRAAAVTLRFALLHPSSALKTELEPRSLPQLSFSSILKKRWKEVGERNWRVLAGKRRGPELGWRALHLLRTHETLREKKIKLAGLCLGKLKL
ncbi:uncharacterized protein LOC127553322 [Antechinus flavipes]|uniref:uncharacterized protein LOC127553322 n=1 Tax=Antechinus flavipes TaxID=38775 RepID=UPI0022358118|nr:uncharacterized protein LOC127553322 [Antechinus flavipes]